MATENSTHEPPFGVLLVNLGTPDAPTAKAVRRYLKEFLSDPRVIDVPRFIWWWILRLAILPFRPKRVARNYQQIWLEDGSPLRVYSEQQRERLAAALAQQYGEMIPVALGMTYGNPSLKQGLLALREQGIKKVLVLPLFPQYSGATTAAVFDGVAKSIKGCPCLPDLRFVRDYYDEPSYIAALAASVESHWQRSGKRGKLLLSFHGIPKRYSDKGDPYPEQCAVTAKLVAERLGLTDNAWGMSFQSRFGPAEWVKPYTLETLEEWARAGIETVDVISPGFASDCLETLEELKVENRQAFIKAGGNAFHYIPALNADKAHIDALAAIVKAHEW
ncbi:MAG: ferrochelatase [Legionellales bacterium]|nr:ferrochelatase [Legionellales bacterium]|tara:strand:- start:18713 stop:19711 length:999 start_codon:yes stop_codon:yes gene_type:complete